MLFRISSLLTKFYCKQSFIQRFVKTHKQSTDSLPYLFQISYTFTRTMTSPENASFLLRIQRTGSILLHITIDIKIRLLHPCNPKNHCNDDSMIRHRPRGKVWKKNRWHYISIFCFFSFFFTSFIRFFFFFFSPSTVESKTIGYLECPREHSSSDTDS